MMMTNRKVARCALTTAIAAMGQAGISRASDVAWDNGSGDFLWNTTSLNWTATSWNNANIDGATGSRLWPRMEGRYVFKHAVTRFPEVVQEALAANGYRTSDLDVFIPHQANLRISEFVAGVLELPPEKVFNNIQRYGNTTAASIPLALYEAREAGLVKPGALVCLGAFGAGFTWAAALMRW